MPVLALPSKPSVYFAVPPAVSRLLAMAARAVRKPIGIPRWALFATVALLVMCSFLAGRRNPQHHYVSYFGYPMVLDTTTGKACYAVAPRPADPATVQDAAFDGTANRLDTQAPSGPQIPLCGKE